MGYWSELGAWVFKDPAKLIRYLVLFICCIVVIVQLYECFTKLYDPPISTHSYYNLNESIEMPAVTICRDPPYKEEVLNEISGGDCMHPKYVTCWTDYPFDQVELKEFFMNSTFNKTETFLGEQYALNGFAKHVEVTSSLHFYMGLCHTLRPKILLNRASKNTGYSMILKHHVNQSDITNAKYENEPGWHIYIHDYRENFTEVNMKGSGRVEYIFADINEDIEIKLQSQQFLNVETREKPCSRATDYSDLKCGEICIWKELAEKSNCSGPWMYNVSRPPCADTKSIRNLTREYLKIYNSDNDIDCGCIQPCESRIFSTYIQNRKNFHQEEPNTQIWIYYTTKLVSMMEESPSYDTTQFIADIGGSLGFLLGLSVLGLIGILEHITLFFCGGFIKKMQLKEENRIRTEADRQSQKSVSTIDVIVTDKDNILPK